jgi:hypothetical protein
MLALRDTNQKPKPHTMTKKQLIQLADHIRLSNKGTFSQEAIREIARFCASQNPAFDRELWMDYVSGKCGPGGGKIKH